MSILQQNVIGRIHVRMELFLFQTEKTKLSQMIQNGEDIEVGNPCAHLSSEL